ncbi:thioredoxin family protein [Flavobacterium gelidilacus]|jgi:thiol-disulfide isomerase/thioredoxin|uniref:thioredoxin family protein n=1 Tax=Flavobacterium gelidilacus TaxID=206041 RepID=UPI000557D4C3|nr:thioredoxin family protein [Flavobacterium gelidilacus]
MKKIILLILPFLFINCSPTGKIITSNNEKMLIGKATKIDLEKAPFDSWYTSGFNEYKPKEEVTNQLKDKVTNITITIFMGTWCEDSQNQVPDFYKVLEACQFKERGITLIAMDRNKTTPENLESGLNITNVPTFIFYEKGVEINRIVESPKVSLEQDMLDILSGKDYKPNYSE